MNGFMAVTAKNDSQKIPVFSLPPRQSAHHLFMPWSADTLQGDFPALVLRLALGVRLFLVHFQGISSFISRAELVLNQVLNIHTPPAA